MKRTLSYILTLVFAMCVFSPTANAASLAGLCAAGGSYDPACDVDHDGDGDIFDIQLTASHWSRTGAWTGGDG